ncbi:hypothetical protein ILT44_29375 [Microvirga sp. BT689]|uniref:hypothetical protein n=1 Tax=Microvirga arvi TaxID=2778731 RepID=UPI0019513975|nr:hypothetical protein [Microvirga arvi]MBM6584309.1 hypothetical protein [Microvirga arvi]
MLSDAPFPLDQFSAIVRTAILKEFGGRCPTIREVARIPDTYWLSTPGIGSSTVEKIHSLAKVSPQRTRPPSPDQLSYAELTDAELLDHLEALRDELDHIRDALKIRMAKQA